MPPEASTRGSRAVTSMPSVSSDPEHARIESDPELLGHPEGVQPRDRLGAVDRAAGTVCRRIPGQAVAFLEALHAERVERPVLEQDVDRPVHRRGAGRERGGGVQLVGRTGEQDDVERRVAHRVVTCVAEWVGRESVLGRGEGAQRGQAPDDHAPHEVAGGEDLGVGEAVADRSSVASGVHQAGGSHGGKVLGDRGLREIQRERQLPHLHRVLTQEVHDPQPVRPGERPDESDLDQIDLGDGVEHMTPCRTAQ